MSPDAVLRSITKSKEAMTTDENFWFLQVSLEFCVALFSNVVSGQDAGGGIWKVDLSFSLTMKKPAKVEYCTIASYCNVWAGAAVPRVSCWVSTGWD